MNRRRPIPLIVLISLSFAALAGCGGEPASGVHPRAGAPPPSLASSTNPLASPSASLELTGTILRRGECSESSSHRDEAPSLDGCSNNSSELSSALAWVSLESVTAPSGTVFSLSLGGDRFTAAGTGKKLRSQDLVGALLVGVTTDGSPVTLRLDSATADSGNQSDVWRYGFSYLDSTGTWNPLCPDGAPAVVVAGRWDFDQGSSGDGSKTDDPTAFTAACQGSAIEKCINAGYKPWAKVGNTSLDAFHQACVRMMRADYCGDGVPHTDPGYLINLYDQLELQVDTEPWVAEAEWTPAGARCLNPLNLTIEVAPCLPRLESASCGDTSHFGTGTLIISETPSTGGRAG